jgi:GAF domain-containing protein/ActR/RegA family two-component response regulator
LANVGALITDSLAPREVQQLIVDHVRHLFEAKRAALYGFDPESTDAVVLAVSGETVPAFAPESRSSRGIGLVAVVERERQPIATTDVLSDARVVLPPHVRAQLAPSELRAVLMIPLISKDVMIGALTVADATGRVFTPEDIRIAQSFAHQAAVALENARLFDAQQHRADRLRTLGYLNQLISSSLDAQEVLGRIAQAAADLMAVPVVEFWIADEPAQVMELRATSNPEIGRDKRLTRLGFGQGGVGWVAQHRCSLDIPDIFADSRIHASEWFRTHGLTSAMWVPIVFQEQFLGVLSLIGRRPLQLSPDDQELLDSLVAQAAVAIRNAKLFAESEARRRAAESLADVGRLLAETLDVDVVSQRVADNLRLLLGASSSTVFRLNEGTGDLEAVATSGDLGPEAAQRVVLPQGVGASGHAVREARPVTTPDVTADPRIRLLPDRRESIQQRIDRAVLAVPLIVQDRVIGVCSIRDRAGRVFTEHDVRLAQALANHAAVAIQNAHLYAESERRRRSLATLVEVSQRLTRGLQLPVVLGSIADAAGQLFGGEAGFRLIEGDELVRVSATAGAPVGMARERLRLGESISGRVAVTGEPIATSDTFNDPRVAPDQREAVRRSTQVGALMCVPIRLGARILGTLNVYRERGHRFGDDVIQVAMSFADQAAVAIENARLYSEAARRQREAEELSGLARSLTETLDVATVSERLVETVLPLFGAVSSGLHLVEPDGSLKAAAWGGGAREYFDVGYTFPPGVGINGRALATGAPAWCRDLLADTGLLVTDDLRRRTEAMGQRAILAVPLRAKGAVIGVLVVVYGVAREFADDEIALLQTFADQAATAIENARLFQEAQAAYQELAHAQDQLVRGETLRALGELSAGAAHHLNNLLAVIVGRVQLMRRRAKPPEFERPLEIVERAALDSAEVVRRMSAFSQARRTRPPEAMDLNRVVRDALDLTRPRWRDESRLNRITIEPRLELGQIPVIAGDGPALREVLVNLILNATDAMPSGGTLTVRTWATPEAVHCAVADTGVGMPPDILQRALEPFFTTKGIKSMGLGLSVNYGVVRKHGGELTLESTSGQGTVASFWLPVAPPPPLDAVSDPGPTRPLRVLLVDDEPEVCRVIADILRDLGHTVLGAGGGREALRRLSAEGPVDVVLTDLGMPEMTGWDVARAVKAHSPTLPVGLITGWGTEVVAKPENAGLADFVLAKPVTERTLRAALATVVANEKRPS